MEPDREQQAATQRVKVEEHVAHVAHPRGHEPLEPLLADADERPDQQRHRHRRPECDAGHRAIEQRGNEPVFHEVDALHGIDVRHPSAHRDRVACEQDEREEHQSDALQAPLTHAAYAPANRRQHGDPEEQSNDHRERIAQHLLERVAELTDERRPGDEQDGHAHRQEVASHGEVSAWGKGTSPSHCPTPPSPRRAVTS